MEDFLKVVKTQTKKVSLTGKDKQYMSELFQVGNSDIYIAYKRTGKNIPVEREIVDGTGKVVSKVQRTSPEADLRVFTMPKLEQNAANSFLLAKDTSKITNLDNLSKTLKSQLTDFYNQAVSAAKPAEPGIFTLTGRKLEPPRLTVIKSDRSARSNIGRVAAWLVDQGKLEAASKGDTWNLEQFTHIDPARMAPAERDGLNLYLFGQERIPLAGFRPPSVSALKPAQN